MTMRYSLVCITPYREAAAAAIRTGATHFISITDPGVSGPLFTSVAEESVLRLALADVTDLCAAGAVKPEQISDLLAFGRRLASGSRVGIHCEQGISRSPAAALILACQELGAELADEAMALVRQLAPEARPNLAMVALADSLLGGEGRIVSAARKTAWGLNIDDQLDEPDRSYGG
jgi:predicted protein tyrosine phosphatase